MDLSGIYFLTTTLMLILQQEARSAHIAGPVPGAEIDKKTQAPVGHPQRVKRCSCENLKDLECVYFCHIGIVWVNTPGQVVPYGVGLCPVRLKRDTARCVCTGGGDTKCLRFCAAEHRQREQERKNAAFSKGSYITKSRERPNAVPLSDRRRVSASET